ncbi:hypothetical protein HK096_010020, partial [Nowakowskiella sp. JEL0078]
AKNALINNPDGAQLTVADITSTRGSPKSVNYSATRFSPFQSIPKTEIRLTQHPSTKTWDDVAKHTPSLFPSRVGSTTPIGNSGFGLVAGTPTPMPHIDIDPEELMTWGTIEGTPFLLDHVGIDEHDLNEVGPKFKIPASPRREEIGLRLAKNASKSLKLKAATGTGTGTPRTLMGGLSPAAKTLLGKSTRGTGLLSPAARSLLVRSSSGVGNKSSRLGLESPRVVRREARQSVGANRNGITDGLLDV